MFTNALELLGTVAVYGVAVLIAAFVLLVITVMYQTIKDKRD